MENQLVVSNKSLSVNDDLMNALRNSLYPGAKDESIMMVISYCKTAGLDPMQKPVHIVPMSFKNENGAYVKKDVIMPGIGLYRIQAARTGEYGGITEPEFGPSITKTLGSIQVTFPEWCKISVRRIVKGEVCDFTVKEFWLENYADCGKSPAPNAMWKKRPYGQLAKCAEAQALRKAYPEIGAQPTGEEMEGKSFEGNGDSVHKEIKAVELMSPEHLMIIRELIEESHSEEEVVVSTMTPKFHVTHEDSERLENFPDACFEILSGMLKKKIQLNQEMEEKRNLLNAG